MAIESVLNRFQNRFEEKKPTVFTIGEWLEHCKTNKGAYASAFERMLTAIGEPVIVDTALNDRDSRIFSNRKIKVYPAFSDFYGLEDVIESMVSFFKHGAQGLEETKQILYLLGPVGGGKSSLSERLKELMQSCPISVLAFMNEDGHLHVSPLLETPLGLFDPKLDGDALETEYGIARRYLKPILSPWAVKRLEEVKGDLSRFRVITVNPSILNQRGITKVEPGDENNQDISALVGKVNIRKLEDHDQSDPDAYNFVGGLNVTTQGIMEFVEMFKAPIKMLHPLLTATQEGHYNGTEQFGAMPFHGIILAHCFSEDTELLTDKGWLTHDKITDAVKLATMNPDTGFMEFQPALKKFEQQYSGPMYHFESDAMDHLVTPNHKMLYHTQYTKDWRKCTAEDFGETGKIVPVSAIVTNPDFDISDDALRLITWVVADGSLNLTTVRWHLAKQRKIERLTALLNRLGLDYNLTKTNYTTTGGLPTTSISMTNFAFIEKSLPEFFYKLSARQADIVIQEYSHTDGSRQVVGTSETDYDSDDVHIQLSSNQKADIDLLQYLAVAAGHKANLSENTKGRYNTQYFLSIRQNTTETRSDYARKKTSYNGTVFCFETANHTLIARRNGKVLITSNSNESEWTKFRNDKNNEAFLDRVYIVKVPYCLRVTEETKIYDKLVKNSDLINAPIAPRTLEILAEYSVMTRLKPVEHSHIFSKMEVYDGKNLKEKDPKAKSIEEYRDDAGINEGMNGSSTRFAFKVISKAYNQDPDERAASPINLFKVLVERLQQDQIGKEEEEKRQNIIKDLLIPKYAEFLGDEINKAFIESYGDYGQNVFDKYILFADAWVDNRELRDEATDELHNREALGAYLEKIEKAAGITNPKEFRNEVVGYCLRYAKNHSGQNPPWSSYEKLRVVIEKTIFANTEELLPVISFGKKANAEEEKKHTGFVERMVKLGYTPKQVRVAVEWHTRYKKNQ